MNSEKQFQVGDFVSLVLWDETHPLTAAFGEGQITSLSEGRSQSGVVANITSPTNRVLTGMDISWLIKLQVTRETQ